MVFYCTNHILFVYLKNEIILNDLNVSVISTVILIIYAVSYESYEFQAKICHISKKRLTLKSNTDSATFQIFKSEKKEKVVGMMPTLNLD